MKYSQEDIETFQKLLHANRYNLLKMAYIVFPFGEKGHEMEHMDLYDWQKEELQKLSLHLMNPATRFDPYRLIISSGNGAAKTSFGAILTIILMYTQRVRARITANTDPQMKSIVWPEYDLWLRRARMNDLFFDKFGTSIKAKDENLSEVWRLDTVTWSEQSPASISGLHNKGGCVMYIFEEAPGIPAVIWDYTRGAFTETETIKIFLAFGNSDDPESKFEQNMSSPLWHSRRIDTRELKHVDPKFHEDILLECGGNEDHDEFRVRVRGLPRKAAKDSIIGKDQVVAAIRRRKGFDRTTVANLPVILTCDPAWTGGDDTTIWMRQGHYYCMLEKYKLDKAQGQDHMFTYLRLCYWEKELGADAVFIDQGEGTAIYTLANNAGKAWELVAFGSNPNDTGEARDSQYGNLRAQMYYEANKKLISQPCVIDAKDEKWLEAIEKQLCWTKGTRHKVTNKKMAESKVDIKNRVGASPDVADGFVLCEYRPALERLPENLPGYNPNSVGNNAVGTNPFQMPGHGDPYGQMDAIANRLYR